MSPQQGSFPPPPRKRAASPAERGAEFAEIQRRLKQEAADRREQAAARGPKPDARPKPRGTPG